jgi:hypothetical protein
MDISINGRAADITLETEKNLGEILAGLEQWLSFSGSRIAGLSINGEWIDEERLEETFGRDLNGIKTLDISVSTWVELAAEAFRELKEYGGLYAAASFDERDGLRKTWEAGAGARFLCEEIPDFYALALRSFSGDGLAPQDLGVLIDERLRELEDPKQEICNAEEVVQAIALRLEDLPLDNQTGKDGRAAETVQLFSRMGEKLFRIFNLFKLRGFPMEGFSIDDLPVQTFLEDFNTALKELTAAYENRDSVLAEDLAEYELAPRLVKFFAALKSQEVPV